MYETTCKRLPRYRLVDLEEPFKKNYLFNRSLKVQMDRARAIVFLFSVFLFI